MSCFLLEGETEGKGDVSMEIKGKGGEGPIFSFLAMLLFFRLRFSEFLADIVRFTN